MAAYFEPCLLGLGPRLNVAKKTRYMRSVNRKAAARNGTKVYRLSERVRNVMTGPLIVFKFTESEYLAALRQQLGLGFEGVAGREFVPDQAKCACRHGTELDDGSMDQHLSCGCVYGNGYRAQAHKGVADVLETLVRSAGLPHQHKEKNVTLRGKRDKDGEAQKHMDLIIDDPDLSKQIWIDIRRTDTLNQSNHKKAETSGVVLRNTTFNAQIAEKNEMYGRIYGGTCR